jgi:kynureninase
MTGDFIPERGVNRFQLSTMPLFSLIPIAVSMEMFAEISFSSLWNKSRQLTAYLEFLLTHEELGFLKIVTPSDPQKRGAQLSIQVLGADSSLRDKLRERGVMVDWREPGVIRAAPVPLYNSFEEVWRFSRVLKKSVGG